MDQAAMTEEIIKASTATMEKLQAQLDELNQKVQHLKETKRDK